jgi:hypothetical protein
VWTLLEMVTFAVQEPLVVDTMEMPFREADVQGTLVCVCRLSCRKTTKLKFMLQHLNHCIGDSKGVKKLES